MFSLRHFFSFLIPRYGKTNMLPRVRLKTHWSICNSTKFVTGFALTTCGLPLSLWYSICISKRTAKDDVRTCADGSCNSDFPPLYFAAADNIETLLLPVYGLVHQLNDTIGGRVFSDAHTKYYDC